MIKIDIFIWNTSKKSESKVNGDNAQMESFWGTLKIELVYHRRSPSLCSGERGRQDLDICHPLPVNSNSMPENLQHEWIGIHY